MELGGLYFLRRDAVPGYRAGLDHGCAFRAGRLQSVAARLRPEPKTMRLFDAIIDANHRAVAGDPGAGVHPADFEEELPVVALTCIDPRLNALFPNVLGLPGEQFIWL